jgi:hypothetical protein
MRALEQERVRTASIAQMPMSQPLGQEKLVDAVMTLPPPETVKQAVPAAPVRVAAAEAKIPAAAKPAKKAGKRSARRTKAVRTRSAVRRSPAGTRDPLARALVELCPLRWLDAALTDMHRRLSARA